MKDRYFWGDVEAIGPSWLPETLQRSTAIVRSLRLLMTMLGLRAFLSFALSAGPLLCSGLLGERVLGPHAEPWMFPDVWGHYSAVLDRGLAGWWGGWWHQTFRFGLDSISKPLLNALRLSGRSSTGQVIRISAAFIASGLMHASASYTMPGPSHPISGSFAFFLLQPGGIMAEVLLIRALSGSPLSKQMPKSVKSVVRFVYVHIWFYFTAPLICDDFARQGVWLAEFVPISPVVVLGFGCEGESWWRWGGPLIHWYQSSRWGLSGFYF